MKVMITGATGQLGRALLSSIPPTIGGQSLELVVTSRQRSSSNHDHYLDLLDVEACRAFVLNHRPDWLINAAAYTAVDRAEQEPLVAAALNAAAPAAFADALREVGTGRMLQLSTDFVFDGSRSSPYPANYPTSPINVYGATKAEAESHLLDPALGDQWLDRVVVLRTSWVYGPVGHNFLLTMLRLHRQQAAIGEPLRVIADQIGCPTSTAGLAQACWRILALERWPRIVHWTDAGVASWFDFAVAIGELAHASGLLEQPAWVEPILSREFSVAARRPIFSRLDHLESARLLGLKPLHWRAALDRVIHQLSEY